MAMSGLIQGSLTQWSSRFRTFIYWYGTRDSGAIAGNYTDVTIEVLVDTTHTTQTWNGTVSNYNDNIDGDFRYLGSFNSNTTGGWTYSAGNSPTGRAAQRIGSRTRRVYHNNDGSKSLNLSSYFELPSGTFGPGTVNISGNVTLDTIPRASTFVTDANEYFLGENIGITITRAATSFTHKLKYSFGSSEGTIAENVATSSSWTPPISLSSQIPSAIQGTCTISCETYNGTTLIGTTTKTVSLKVPTNIVPSISSVALSELVSGLATKFATYVQNKSRVRVQTTSAGIHGSTINHIRVVINGETLTGADVSTNILNTSGNNTCTVTVTDTRNRSTSTSVNFSVAPYTNPFVETFRANRSDASGNYNQDGGFAAIDIKAVISPVNNRNDKSFILKYKRRDLPNYTTQTLSNTNYTLETRIIVPNIDVDYTYDFIIDVTDFFMTQDATDFVDSSFSLIDYRHTGLGIAFGKSSEKDAFECNMPSEFKKRVDLTEAYLNGNPLGVAAAIIDNLTSTSASNPLSANQGRVLNTTKVGLSGNETVNGIKTFPSLPVSGTATAPTMPTADNQLTVKRFSNAKVVSGRMSGNWTNSFPLGGFAKVPINTPFDTPDSAYFSISNNEINILRDGIYMVSGSVSTMWNFGTGGRVALIQRIRAGVGRDISFGYNGESPGANRSTSAQCPATMLELLAGDIVRLNFMVDTGTTGSRSDTIIQNGTYLNVAYLSGR